MPSWAIGQKIAVWTCVCGSLVGEGVYWTTLSADNTAAAQEGYNEQHQRCQHTCDLESIPTRAPSPIIIWKLPLNNNTIASLTGLLPLQPTPVLSTPFESCTCTLWAQGIIAEKLWPAKTESSCSHTLVLVWLLLIRLGTSTVILWVTWCGGRGAGWAFNHSNIHVHILFILFHFFPLHFWQILTLVVLVLSWATTYHMNQVADITIPQLYSVPCSMAWPRTFWSYQNKLI